MPTHRLLPFALAAAFALPPSAASAAQVVYTTTPTYDEVNRFVVGSDGALGAPQTVVAGDGATDIAISPDARRAYVANRSADTLSPFSVGASGALAPLSPPAVATADDPREVEVTPDGRHVLVLEAAQLEWFAIDDEGDLTQEGAVAVDFAGDRMALSPDGSALFVVSIGADRLQRFAIGADGTLTAGPAATVAGALEVAVSPDGSLVWAVSETLQILRFDPETLAPRGEPVAGAFRNVMALAFTPDNAHLVTGGAPAAWDLTPDGTPTLRSQAAVTGDELDAVVTSADGDTVYGIAETLASQVFQLRLGTGTQLAYQTPSGVAQHGRPTSIAITPEADMTVTQGLPAAPAAAGREVTYTITATNRKGTPASQVRIGSVLPAGLTLLEASTPDGTCLAGGAVHCVVPSLADSHSATVTVRARATSAGSATLTSEVSALQPDADPANNTTTGAIAVEPQPGALTTPASSVSAAGATLNGVVAPAGTGARYRFEYGATTAYGAATAWTGLAGLDGRLVSAELTGLAAATAHHFRVVVVNDEGVTVAGDDAMFTTAPAPAPAPEPRVETRVVTVTTPAPPVSPPVAPRGDAPAADRTAPRLSALTLRRDALSLTLSEAATGRATVEVARTRRVRRDGKLRTERRWVTARTVTVRATGAGRVTARIAPQLAPGRYRVTVAVRDAAGNDGQLTSAPRVGR